MTFTWHFFTGGDTPVPPFRRCHRGPMIDVEIVMSQQYVLMSPYNTLRKRLLDDIVNTDLVAVQTREVVLRTINSEYGSIFARLRPQKASLQVEICEKRNVIDIEADLETLNPFYVSALRGLTGFGVPKPHLDRIETALLSNSPIFKVVGKCATILLISFIELDANG